MLAIQLLTLVAVPCYSFIDTGSLTTSAVCVTAFIQHVRGELSDYHRTTAHQTAIIMLPAIGSMIVKCMRIRKWPPILTICASMVCTCLNVGLLSLVFSILHQHCLFDGKVDTNPVGSFPNILFAGVVILFIIFFVLAVVQYVRIFERWRKYVFIVGIIGQIGGILSSIGFILFIELLVQEAQQYLIGGSEDKWGFGQILALSLLVIPTVERIKYAYEKAEEDHSLTNFQYWRRDSLNHLRNWYKRGMYSFLRLLIWKGYFVVGRDRGRIMKPLRCSLQIPGSSNEWK